MAYKDNKQRAKDVKLTNRTNDVNDVLMHRAGTEFERIHNSDLQKRGIDIVIHDKRNGDMLVDEKAAIDYRSLDKKDLQTYSIELGSCNNPDKAGWFLSDHMLTTHYMFMWFKSDEDITRVHSCESALVAKSAIKSYLAQRGLDTRELTILKDELSEYRRDLLAGREPRDVSSLPGITFKMSDNGDRIYCEDSKYGLRLTCSLNKAEMPINVLIPKADLQRMAVRNYTLTAPMYDVAKTHEIVMAEHEPKKIPMDKIVKAVSYFNDKSFVSGQLYYGPNEMDVHQGRMTKCGPGTMLFYGDKIDLIPVATFDGKKWTALVDGFKEKVPVIIGPDRKKTPVQSYEEHIQSSLAKGEVPYGFTQKDCLHRIVNCPSRNQTFPIQTGLTNIEGLTNMTILTDSRGISYDVVDREGKLTLEEHIEEDADRELHEREEAAEDETDIADE